jgi:hypothetical protein
VAAAIAVRHLLNIWWFAPCVMDEFEYHLPKLASWIQHGDLVRPVMVDTRACFPSGMQILQIWWVGILRHDAFIEGASMEALALTLVATVSMARSLGVSRPAAIVAAVLLAAAPAFGLHATGAMNDLPAAALIVAAFALARSKATVPLGIAALLLGAGIKPVVLFAAPAVLVFAARSWREPAARPRLGSVLLIGLAAFTGGYWYGINAVQYGNPFHPVPLGSGGGAAKVSIGPATVSTRPSPSRLARNVGAVFGPRMYAFGDVTNPTLPDRTGWGWVLAVALWPAALWEMRRGGGEWRRALSGAALGTALVLLMVEHDPWNARFVMFAAAFAACAIAWTAAQLGRAAGVIVLAVSLAGVWEARTPVSYTAPGAAEFMRARSLRDRDAFAVSFRNAPPSMVARFLESSDPVLCITFNFPVYALARGDFRRRLEYSDTDNPDGISELMRTRGCRWLLTVGAPSAVFRAADELVRRGELRAAAPGLYERP